MEKSIVHKKLKNPKFHIKVLFSFLVISILIFLYHSYFFDYYEHPQTFNESVFNLIGSIGFFSQFLYLLIAPSYLVIIFREKGLISKISIGIASSFILLCVLYGIYISTVNWTNNYSGALGEAVIFLIYVCSGVLGFILSFITSIILHFRNKNKYPRIK